MDVLADPTPAPTPHAQLPSSPVPLPDAVTGPLFTLFSWLLWAGIVAAVAAVFVCAAILVDQRKSGRQIVEAVSVIRILVGAIILGSAASIAQAIL